jgi:flagellar hook-length control protein FliK
MAKGRQKLPGMRFLPASGGAGASAKPIISGISWVPKLACRLLMERWIQPFLVRSVLTSVSAVASAEIRQNFSTQQSNAGDDPFSLLLDAVTDVNVAAPREAPQPAERRDDVPAQQPKLESDNRQTKRRASDADQPEKPKAEAAAGAKDVASDDAAEETEETDSDEGDEDSLVETLLALALGETPQPEVAANGQVKVEATVQTPAANAVTVQVPAVAVANSPALVSAAANVVEAAGTQAAQVAGAIKGGAAAETGTAPVVAADLEAEIALPDISADSFAKLLKPLKALPAAAGVSAEQQPVTIEASASISSRALATLETLNAALTKHLQLSANLDADASVPEAQKPAISSNAVMPNFALTAQATASVNAQTQVPAEVARAVPLESLAVEIATRAKNGERRFDIRLDPPELGRIDVRLEIDHKGNTSTKLIVERAETLDMLQRDARNLEKALQSAGLKTDAGGLEFTLRQDTQTQQNQPNAPQSPHRPDVLQIEEEVSAQVALGNASLAAQLRGGVDIRI